MKEDSMIPKVERFMLQQGYHSYRQVPLGSKRIDLLCYLPDMTELVAIEFKVNAWRKGVEQALTRRLCADKVYLALPEQSLRVMDLELLSKYGLGLIVVSEIVRVALEASCSSQIHSTLREEVAEFIRSQNGGE